MEEGVALSSNVMLDLFCNLFIDGTVNSISNKLKKHNSVVISLSFVVFLTFADIMQFTRRSINGLISVLMNLDARLPHSRLKFAKQFSKNCWTTIGFLRIRCSRYDVALYLALT